MSDVVARINYTTRLADGRCIVVHLPSDDAMPDSFNDLYLVNHNGELHGFRNYEFYAQWCKDSGAPKVPMAAFHDSKLNGDNDGVQPK